MLRGTHGTNQNFIARPGNADTDSTGCQDKPLPHAQPTRNFRPAGVHRRGTKPWRAQEVEGQCFRKHPESNLHGTGILCPEQLREFAKSCPAASPAHPLLKACHQTQGHATQESQVATADPSQNAGCLENGARPPDCHE